MTVPRRVLPAVLTGEDGSVSRVGPPDPLRGRNNQYTVPDGQYTVPDGPRPSACWQRASTPIPGNRGGRASLNRPMMVGRRGGSGWKGGVGGSGTYGPPWHTRELNVMRRSYNVG